MIAVVDYDVGNLRSVVKALEAVGAPDVRVIRTPAEARGADRLVLPGVGAFRDAVAALHRCDMADAVRTHIAAGRPFLGICLGMQMLFDRSHEDGEHRGLGIIAGEVVRFVNGPGTANAGLKVPHMGWNRLHIRGGAPLLAGVETGSHVYFVHSYHVRPADDSVIAAETEYGGRFAAAVWKDNIHAVQFHPEKSQRVGLRMLENFVKSRE